MDEKYFIQKGSFMYVLVGSENSNPDWANKPFEVIEKTKFDELQKQLEISNRQVKLGEMLNNDLLKEVDRLEKENTELRTRLECCVDMSIVSRLNEELEEKQRLLDEALEVINVSANQLEGVSLGIARHGQNISVHFFVTEYKKMADDKREFLRRIGR